MPPSVIPGLLWPAIPPSPASISTRISNSFSYTWKPFGSIKNLSNNDGNSIIPQMDLHGSNVYIVWQDKTPGDFDIFFRVSTNNGSTFASTKNLSNNDGESSIPQIISSGGNVYVVWQDKTQGDFDIFFRKGVD